MKIIAYIPGPTDATNFYRGQGPLSELRKLDQNIDVTYIWKPELDIFRFKGADIFFMQRPDQRSQLTLMREVAKTLKLPIIIDYDDNVFDKSIDSKYALYNKKFQHNDYIGNTRSFLSDATEVWTTTEALKDKLSAYNTNVQIIKNAFDDYIFTTTPVYNRNKRILWRGSEDHEEDLRTHKDSIIKAIQENPDFEFVFISEAKFDWMIEIEGKYKNFFFLNSEPTYDYFGLIERLRPSIFMVPLNDSPFNRCKSDVAAIEALYSGAKCIAPDWPEWHELKNIINYNCTPEGFLETLQHEIDRVRKNAGFDPSTSKIIQINGGTSLGTLEHTPEPRKLSDINKIRLERLRKYVK